MKTKYLKKEKGQSYSARPRKPAPKETGESADTLYHIAIVIMFGISLCLGMAALDYVLQDTTPTANTTETIEYFE
jgi:hypothetical protein